jgi:hypothetical protein
MNFMRQKSFLFAFAAREFASELFLYSNKTGGKNEGFLFNNEGRSFKTI